MINVMILMSEEKTTKLINDKSYTEENKQDADKNDEIQDDLINNNNNQDESQENKQENETEMTLNSDIILAITSGVIKNSYDKIGKSDEGIQKVMQFQQLNKTILEYIPFDDALRRKTGKVKMTDNTALIIGGGCILASTFIMMLPALKERKQVQQLQQKNKKQEKKQEEETKGDTNG